MKTVETILVENVKVDFNTCDNKTIEMQPRDNSFRSLFYTIGEKSYLSPSKPPVTINNFKQVIDAWKSGSLWLLDYVY